MPPGFDRWTTERLLAICQNLSNADLGRELGTGNRFIRRGVHRA